MKYFIPLLILGFIIILVFAFTAEAQIRLPATIEINYCGKKQTYNYLELRDYLIAVTDQESINPCFVKGYIKMLNIEHNLKKLKPDLRKGKDFFRDLNNQIKTRTL